MTTATTPATTPDTDRADNATVTVTEAAALLGVSERTARRYAATGKLTAERVTGPDGRAEWHIYRHSVDNLPNVTATVRTAADRKAADTVPLELYREAQAQLSGALLQVGQLTEVRHRLELAEHTESTMREMLAATATERDMERERADRLAEELAAAQHRRRWFRRQDKSV